MKVQAKQMRTWFAQWSREHKATGGCGRCSGPQFPAARLPRVALAAMDFAIGVSVNDAGYTMSEDGWHYHQVDPDTAKALAWEIAAFLHEEGEALIPWGEDPDKGMSGNVGVEFIYARNYPEGFVNLKRWGNGNPFFGEVQDKDVEIIQLDKRDAARLAATAAKLGPWRLVAKNGALFKAPDLGMCQWFALCDRYAGVVLDHPAFPEGVPACTRCASKDKALR